MIKLNRLHIVGRLDEISCTISQGKLVGIMGANGAGKSTLLKAIAGILPPTSGEIYLENCALSQLSAAARSQKVAYLAQNLNVAWTLSVYDVIALGLPHKLAALEEKRQVYAVAECFSIQTLLAKNYQQLSGGEKARVQLARCAIKNAPLLLADEPIAALDPYYQLDIMAQLRALTPMRTCVIVIHHLALAYRFCDEIILLKEGKMIAAGNTQAVLNSQNLAQAFGVCAKIDELKRDIYDIQKM